MIALCMILSKLIACDVHFIILQRKNNFTISLNGINVEREEI